MKVLVFDDSEIHRQSAVLTLGKEHDLTVVSTYDQAQKALTPQTDYDLAKNLEREMLAKAGFSADFDRYGKDVSEADKAKYDAVSLEAYRLATTYPNFDVVLTDLLVPASRQAQGDKGERLVGQEMPLGTTIALLALCNGVKNVAVVTDMNHHHHPASAAFDCFSRSLDAGPEGIKILCTNHTGVIGIDTATGELVDNKFLQSDESLSKYPFSEGQGYGDRSGLTWGGKNWKLVLDQLLR